MTIEVSRSVDSIAFYEPEELAHFFVFYGAYRLIVSAGKSHRNQIGNRRRILYCILYFKKEDRVCF